MSEEEFIRRDRVGAHAGGARPGPPRPRAHALSAVNGLRLFELRAWPADSHVDGTNVPNRHART